MATPESLSPLAPQAGASLVELLVTLCILGTTLAAGVPALAQLVQSMKLQSANSALLAQLHLARSEAIKRNARVALCKSPEGTSCTTAGGWEQGWIVFHDADNDGQRSGTERIIGRAEALPQEMRMRGNATVSDYISFTSSGATRTASGAFQAGTFTVCRASQAPTQAHQIVINAVGRPRTARVSVSSCG